MKIEPEAADPQVRLPGFRIPAELVLIVVVIAVLGVAAAGRIERLQVTSGVARVHGELAWLRRGVMAYKADLGRYPRMSWGMTPVAGYHPHASNGTLLGDNYHGEVAYGTLTSAITTPVAYLAHYDLLDPTYPLTGQGAPLYTYQAAWCHDTLRSLSYPGDRHPANSATENSVFRHDMGEFFLLSIGPKGQAALYWPAVPGGSPVDGFFTQYDPTNGLISAGTIYISDKHAEPVQRPYWFVSPP